MPQYVSTTIEEHQEVLQGLLEDELGRIAACYILVRRYYNNSPIDRIRYPVYEQTAGKFKEAEEHLIRLALLEGYSANDANQRIGHVFDITSRIVGHNILRVSGFDPEVYYKKLLRERAEKYWVQVMPFDVILEEVQEA